MASPPPSLADELKSLRIDRVPAGRSLPRWIVPAVAVAAVAVAALIGDAYAPEFSSHRASAGRLNGVLGGLPLVPGAMESSLWLTKR